MSIDRFQNTLAPSHPIDAINEVPLDRDANTVIEGSSLDINEEIFSSNQMTIEEMDVTRLYLGEIGQSPLLSAEEEIHFTRLAHQGDMTARNRMISSNLRLVVKIARRYINRGLTLLDLIEEGNLGLIHAVGKFDPERGFRFSTYATWWIRQSIERGIMNQARTIRLPIHVIKDINSCLRARRILSTELQREATIEEVATHLERPLAEVQKLLQSNEKMASVELFNYGDDQKRNLLDAIPDDESGTPYTLLENEDISKNLVRWLHTLNEKQRVVIERRFGLGNFDPQTLEEVGEALGVTRERVRQIQIEGLMKMRKILLKEGFSKDMVQGL